MAIILGWLAAAYALLLLGAGTWWIALPLTVSLGLAVPLATVRLARQWHARSSQGGTSG